jgi:hypothetical protein
MLKGMCSRRRIIISASLRRPSSPSTTSPRRTSFSRRKTLNEDTHTTVALVSCMSSSFNQVGNFVRAPFSIYQATLCARPFQSRRQLCARAPFNQEGNFVRTPFSIKKATSVHGRQATLNIDSFIIHPFHIFHCVHYS